GARRRQAGGQAGRLRRLGRGGAGDGCRCGRPVGSPGARGRRTQTVRGGRTIAAGDLHRQGRRRRCSCGPLRGGRVNKIFAVIRREFVERVRTRAFIIGTLLFPVLMIFFMVMPVLMMSGSSRAQRIAIVDGTTDEVGSRIEAALARQTMSQDGADVPRYSLTRVAAPEARIEAVRDSLVGLTGFSTDKAPDGFDGVLVVTPATLVEGRASYFGSNVSSLEVMSRFESAVSGAVRSTRLERAGVSQEVVAQALIPTQLRTTKVEEGR